MDGINLEAPGNVTNGDELKSSKGRELRRLLSEESIEYARLIECRRGEGNDIVVFEVEVELGQLQIHPIKQFERIAAVFTDSDNAIPETLALRTDFPRVPHLNLRLSEFPRSLCLYDQPYEELKRHWTSPRYVERVRSWLALTAKGKLHSDDQPLEPLLWGHVGHIVLPSDLFNRTEEVLKQLVVSATTVEPLDTFLIAESDNGQAQQGLPYVPILLKCLPQNHGIIRFKPRTLSELAELTVSTGFDLLDELRQQINKVKGTCEQKPTIEKKLLDSAIIILLSLPKTRYEDGLVESTDIWAFLTGSTVRDVGIDIGLWMDVDGILGKEPFPPENKTGNNIGLELLNPLFALSPADAASMNGLQRSREIPAIVAIGAGALGSQLIVNSARIGLERCTIIDHDRLFPHNLARHALPGGVVGFPKAEAVASFANSITDGEPAFKAIVADVLKPGDKQDRVTNSLAEANVIVDTSASVAVARLLANDVVSEARRVSLFLNPTGNDLIVLAEDVARLYPLDALEMQYYRALVNNDNLDGHFTPIDDRRRYGQSCRDVTSRIPQESVAIHAAVGTRALRSVLNDDGATITIWRSNDNLEVRKVAIRPAPIAQCEISDWKVKFDTGFLTRLYELRESRLPNETGGVLIGTFDLERRIAYLVDTIPSPPDSDEWPTLYVRGSKGLKRQVENIVRRTDGALHYMGEWHSHPRNHSTMPSQDDLQVFAWLTSLMDRDGFPALMMIVGDVGRTSCFIGTMIKQERLIPNV